MSEFITETLAGVVIDMNGEHMYEQIKSQLSSAGELMVKMSDGQTFELHLHNTSFDDSSEMIKIDAGTALYWLRADEIIYTWIHRHAIEG